MLWSLLKIVVFVALAAAAAWGGAWLMDSDGGVTVAFAQREFVLSPLGAVVGLVLLLAVLWVAIRLAALLVALLRFVLGDETALSRHFNRSRERRGYWALADSLVALAEGDPQAALRRAERAERLLRRPEVTGLLGARAAELAGDRQEATEQYKSLLDSPKTRFAGIMGLLQQKLEEGNQPVALELALKARDLRPGHPGLLNTLFDLQCRRGDWTGARQTLSSMAAARVLPRDVVTRREAVLSLADARSAIALGDVARGEEAALQANKLAPTLVPAAVLAARVQVDKGQPKKASKLLATAWAANPHPDIAAAYATIEPGETPTARRKRFGSLVASAAGDDTESRLLAAELALAAEDFPGARKALGDLATVQGTARALALMAAIERGQGEPDAVVRGWLAKAIDAPRGPQWICGKCQHVHGAWLPVCENCGAFDTLTWTAAPYTEDPGLTHSALLPVIMADLATARPPVPVVAAAPASRKEAPVDVTPPRPDVEDAELAAGAEAPARSAHH